MARDYAKYNAKKRGSNTKNRLIWLFLAFFLLIMVGTSTYWFFKHKLPLIIAEQGEPLLWTNIKKLFHKKETKDQTHTANTAEAAKQEEVHFDFYDELPNIKVAASSPPSASNAVVPATAPSAPKKVVYTLQLGKFNNENEASSLRVSMLLAGVEAELEKVGNTYWVRQGQFSSPDKAKIAQNRLQKKGIESTVVKY